MLESGLQNTRPPLLVGERAVWLGSGSGLPQGGTVRWMGKLQGMGPGWTVGLELDRSLPYGGIDGSWCGRQLFQCRTKHGLLVPANVVVKEDALLRTFGISPVILNKPPPTPPTQVEPRAPSQQSISEISISSTNSQNGVTKPKRTKHPSGDSRSSQSSVSKKKPAPQPPVKKSETPKPPLPQQQQQSSEIKQTENQITSPLVKVSSLKPNLNPLVEENKLENRPDSLPLKTTSIQRPAEILEVKPEILPIIEVPIVEVLPIVEEPIVEVPPTKPASHKKNSKAPLPPVKAGYFHTAPARPNRNLRGVKQSAPAVPGVSEENLQQEQPAEQASSLPHNSNKETAEYAWSAGVEQRTTTPPRVPLRRHNSYNGPRQTTSESSSTTSLTPNVAPATVDELIYQWFDANENPPTAPPRHGKFKPPSPSMNKSITPSLSPTSSTSSFEDAIAAADAIYSERFNKRFAVDSASSISSNSSSNNNNNNNRKSGSGFLSFLRWLRKGGSDTSDEKVNELSHAGSTNSLGTVVSAASSFAYVSPTAYNLTDNRASLHYSPSPSDTETYKYRIKQRDHARKLDKNLTLKRKYKLKQFACSQETVFSDTLKPSVTNAVIPKPSTGSGRRRNKRPAPPIPTKKSEHYSDCSLPVSLEQRARLMMDMMDDSDKPGVVKLHRRTASESSKDKRAGAYCHVRGKRRAPQPPANIIRQNGALSYKFKNPFPSFGRKKRQAPTPPASDISETSTKLSNEEKQRLISNINKLKLHAAGRNDRIAVNGDDILQGPAVITAPPIVLNALHLQEGDPPPVTPEPVANKAAMSPKPWYKRNSNKVAKVEKRVKKDEEEMPEVGYARVLPSPDENKRKSVQLSMLASISELDREAAEIVQNQHKRAAELIAARNNSFYLPPTQDADSPTSSTTITPSATTPESPTPPTTPDSPNPKVHTKGLISMFNAITNVSKVTVNSSTAAIAGFFNGDARKNRISQTFAIVEEDEEEKENSTTTTTTNVEITEVQSSSSQITSKTISINNNEDIKIDIKQANKDISEVKITSNSSQIVNENKDKVLLNKENVKESKQEIVVKESVKESNYKKNSKVKTKENVKENVSEPADDIVKFNGNSVKRSLYPRLSAFEPKEQEKPKETPLPLSISGISDNVSPRRQKRIVWSCPRCTLENPRWRLTCDVCDMWRPSSTHEETILPFEGSIHAEPKHLLDTTTTNNNEEKDKIDNDIDELKPPEPIGAIDWEAELKRYFDPMKETKIEEKKQEPVKKPSPLINPKVEEAIKILEGKQPVIESPKLRTKVSNNNNNIKTPESPKLKPAVKKEPEYAALVKKTPVAKLGENVSVVNKNPQPYKPPVATSSSGGVIKNEVKKVTEVKPTPQKAPIKTAEAVKVPETFIGGRSNKTENETPKVTTSEGKTVAGTSTTGEIVAKILTKEDVDEVRKARLAFFNKPQDSDSVTSETKPPASPKITRATQSPVVPSSPRLGRAKTTEIATDTQELLKITMAAIATPAVTAVDREERMKLREKLKEMKNSLPKHDRPEVKEIKKEPVLHISEVSQGAIKKVTASTATSSNKPEVGYENVRSRRVLNKPVKVSTSVQTGGVATRKPKVEEPVDTESPAGNIKGGKLYTSLSKSPSFRGTGTFQLIGAKDFATIEATKSQKSAAAPLQHVYANVPSPGLVQEGTSELTKNVPVPVKIETPPPPPPVVVTEKPEPKPVTPSPAAPNQVVVKVETKALVIDDDDDDDEEMMFAEDQSASGVIDDALNLSGEASDIEKLAGMLTRPKGLAEFKADLAASPPQQQSNTLAVNRLLRRLEAAIANGQHRIAAGLARDLARLKISCSVVRQRKAQIEPEVFSVDMYVEDKVSHQGPIPLSVSANMTVGELKVKVQQEFEIPANVQRWILGKQLAADDTKTLQQHSVAAAGCTVFLYLVAPPERTDSSSPATEPSAPAPTPPPAGEGTRIVPTVEPPRGPGWYYNFEEDRYSYCESSDEDDVSEPEPDPPKPAVLQTTAAQATPPASAPVIKLAEPEVTESSSEEEEEEEEEEPGAAGGLLPTAPPATLSTEKKTGTLMLGWKCPVCTLINSPTRPGCAACTTERPITYRVPTAYEASEAEAQRLKREDELEKAAEAEEAGLNAVGTVDNYQALLALDNTDLVSNVDMFECSICMAACLPGDGAMLRECLHSFCRACLAHTAQFSEEVEVRCPFRNKDYACDATMQEREVRALVPPEIYERMQAKSVAQAENKIQNAFHCKTPDCRGWCIFEDNVNDFACPVCGHHNCLTCQSIHDGINCRQYQERVTQASETDAEARRTKEMLEEMVERGEALCCPTCQVVLMKKWGCDWLRCSMCKTEICWVTRGPRWGPGGKGDTSGGCKCGINGIKCHPKCNYCH